MSIYLNDAERQALRGLISIARESYVFGIRPFMDYATGIVGIHRGISYQSISEEVYVDSHQGIKAWRPTEKQLRHAIEWLEKRGLIERQKDTNKRDRKLVFRLPLATTDQSVQKKVGSKWADEQGSHKRSNDAALREEVGNTEPAKVGIPPLSDKELPKGSSNICAFAEFWKSYPVKKGKAKAERLWKSKRLDRIADQILEDVKARQDRDRKWLAGYIPHGDTYVSKEVWQDEIEENPAGATTSAPGRAQPQQHKGRTHENYSRPRNRAERCESAWERNVEALERSLAEEAEAELDRRTVDEASRELRGEVVRLLPRRNGGNV